MASKKHRKRAIRAAEDKHASGLPKELEFFYQKSNQFRVIHVDGAHGGVTPSGSHLHMAVFSERRPIPKSETYPVTEKAELGPRAEVNELAGVLREVEASLILDIKAARALHRWLGTMITKFEKMTEEVAAATAAEKEPPTDTEKHADEQNLPTT